MSQPEPSDIRIELRFEKFSAFVERYSELLSLGGMFIETDDDRPVGSLVDFEIKLTDGFRLMQGLGEVIWARRAAAGPDRLAGLGVRFQALNDEGRELILKILEDRVRSGLDPFDVEEIPADVSAAEAAETAEPAEAAASAAAAAKETESAPAAESPEVTDTGSRAMPDLEKKILGEDGFTLIDTEQAKPDAEEFEEVSFDAPWGKALPDLPEEVLEEGSEAADESPGVPESNPPDVPGATAVLDAVIAEAEASVPAVSSEEARLAALDDSMALAAEAAAELDASPPGDVLDEPAFDDIDFGPLPEDGDLEAAGAGVDFAFDPDPEDQLPPLESAAKLDEADDNPFAVDPPDDLPTMAGGFEAAGDDPTVSGGREVLDDDPTLITSGPTAALDDDLTAMSSRVAASEVDLPVEASFAELADDPAPAVPSEGFDFADGNPFESSLGSQGSGHAEPPSFPPTSPPAEVAIPPAEVAIPPAEAAMSQPGGDPGGGATALDATVSVGGAPLPVQDYEDDLFADAPGSGSAKRPVFPMRWLAAAGLLVALGGAGYVLRGPITELLGLGEAPPAGPRAAGPRAAASQPDSEPSGSEARPADVAPPGDVDATPSVENDPSFPSIEVSEALPSAGDAAGDPTAEQGDVAPPLEAIAPPLESSSPSSSPASRVERISWSRDGEGTRVTVSLNGRLDDRRYGHRTLDYAPAREMIRITGIDEPYVSNYLDVGTPQVARIRIGHHPGPGGGELHVVFDYPRVGPRLQSIRNLGGRLEILIAGQ